jgi:2-polyprenyl-3-methyl-5-hydroxy-6-metoxy-1,4-benzoquinol methylase
MTLATDVEARARLSLGTSAGPIYRTVAVLLAERRAAGVLVDVGCGTGNLRREVGNRFSRYIGADVVRYDGFPEDGEFHAIDTTTGHVHLGDGLADVVTAVETIEHVENPRAFARELTRLCRPGQWVVVTTPNQLSLLSKLTLVLRHEFNAFRDSSYPAHLTALLEVDLRRIASECGWTEVTIRYTGDGRIPGTSLHYPGWLSRLFPRALSDNVALAARTSTGAHTG